MQTHITVIGAGFCGTALLRVLARHAGAGMKLALVGVADSFGRGIAYGAARPEHLLNVRAQDLGIDSQNAGAFADALHLEGSARQAFLPRLAYGDYLRNELDAAIAASQSSILRLPHQAVTVTQEHHGFRVLLANGETLRSDTVVLAVGALQPHALAGIGPCLRVDARYIAWPWQGNVLERIDRQANVLIVGTGLTMADVVLTLRARGHNGRLVAISRHGLAPLAHVPVPHPPLELPPYLQRALADADLAAVLRGVRQCCAMTEDWRWVVDALRPHVQSLWQRLDWTMRARFLRHVRPYWEVMRHRLAPSAAEQIAQLQRRGQLRFHAARLLSARCVPDGVEVATRVRGAADTQIGHYDAVIRATGLDTDVDRTADPLIAGLRQAGLLRADPLSLGIDVDEDLRVLDASGCAVAGLYCVGPLLRGRYWEITAVPELRVAVQRLAQHIWP